MRAFDELAVARRWPFRLAMSVTAIGMAISGVSDWCTAGVLIGSGMALDVLRCLLPFSRMPQNLTEEIVNLAQQDRKTIARRTRPWKLIEYPILAIFAAVGFAYYLFAPISAPIHDAPQIQDHNQNWIFQVSYVCRQFVADLNRHGYVDRADLLSHFYSVIFGLFFLLTVLGCLTAPKSLALDWGCRAYQRARLGGRLPASFNLAIIVCGLLAMGGFFAANNLDFVSWDNIASYQSVYASNKYFLVYSFVMGAVSFFITTTISGTILTRSDLSNRILNEKDQNK